MATLNYENHSFPNPLLPFILHKKQILCDSDSFPNWHENIEILYCTAGEGYIKTESETATLTPGTLFIVNPNVFHDIRCEKLMDFYCLIIDTVFWKENGIPISSIRFCSSLHDSLSQRTYEAVIKASQQYDASELLATADLRIAVLNLMRHLCLYHIEECEPFLKITANNRIKKAIAFIRENLSSPLSLEIIAHHVGISKYYLAREFKMYTGMTVIEAINQIRCTQARMLIEQGLKISSVSTACGFENLSYFSRTFKKYFHQLPSSFSPHRVASRQIKKKETI